MVSMALVEDLQRRGEDRVLAIVRWMAALDRDQRGDHRVPPADRVREQLAPQLRVLALPELRGGTLGEVDVEHVEVPAAAAEPDDLAVERGDQVDVVGFEVAEHERQHPEPGQAERHPADAGALPEPLESHHERGRGGQQAGVLKPADRVPADGRAGQQVLAQRRSDQRGAGADRERPQPTRLHARGAPLGRWLQVHAATAPRPRPAARTRQRRSRALARFLWRPASHSAWRTCSGIFRCAGRNSPSGSAAANAESWEPHTGRRLIRAVGARFSTAALAA